MLIVQRVYSADVIADMALNSRSDNEGSINGKKVRGFIDKMSYTYSDRK